MLYTCQVITILLNYIPRALSAVHVEMDPHYTAKTDSELVILLSSSNYKPIPSHMLGKR